MIYFEGGIDWISLEMSKNHEKTKNNKGNMGKFNFLWKLENAFFHFFVDFPLVDGVQRNFNTIMKVLNAFY